MSLFDIFGIFLIILIVIVLFYFAFRFFLQPYFAKNGKSDSEERVKGKNICPICHSMLYNGEKIISRVYKEENAKEQSCTIHGCPHCYPNEEIGVKRECPVCHKSVPTKGHLRAILFTREGEKKHVHIVGCTECQRKR